MEKSTNVRVLLTNEISLEGLDGITFQGLWLRLSEETKTQLPFPLALEIEYWNIIRHNPDFNFFQLKEPRQDLVIYDRHKYFDSELSAYYEPDDIPNDIYGHWPINDNVSKVRGSCATYYAREDITNIARETEYLVAKEQWGSKFVIVATQECRENILFGNKTSESFDLTLIQYCILERIGRSRYLGEITQGKRSLQIIGEEPKSLFYHRKVLLKYKLITKQIYFQKHGLQNISGTLLHLQRFYTYRKSRMLNVTEQIVEYLKTKPNCRAQYSSTITDLNLNPSVKKLFKSAEFHRFVKTDVNIPYRELYPDSNPSLWKNKNNSEKIIRVIELIDPNIDVAEEWQKLEEDDDDEDEGSGYLNYENLCYGVPLLSQAAQVIRSFGEDGCSQTELGDIMGQSKLSARMFCRNLLRRNVISCIMHDVGRQRVTRFVSRKYENKGHISLQFKQERDKMIAFLTDPGINSTDNTSDTNLDTSLESENNELNESVLSESVIEEPEEKKKKLNEPETIGENEKKRSAIEELDEKEREVKKSKMDISESETKMDMDIDVKLAVAKLTPTLKGSSQSFVEILKGELINPAMRDNNKVTYRLLRRANFIIECVRHDKVIADLSKLIKMIKDDETDEGYNAKIDKKSLMRLILKLAKEGQLKCMKATLTSGVKTKSICFICDPNINEDHSVIQSALEQAKMKFYIDIKPPPVRVEKKKEVAKDVKEKKKPKAVKVPAPPTAKPVAIKKGGNTPKFVRMRRFHELLFYLIYERQYDPISDPDELRRLFRELDQEVDDDLLQELTPVYNTEKIDWKLFIPPLPVHVGWPQGWAILCDVLLRLPLSILVHCCPPTTVIERLDEYLNHPIKRHFLVRNLPLEIRNQLLHKRKYIFTIHSIICRLCFIGLIQFGPQQLKEKDQVFIYLNRNASVYNTVTSEPGYHEVSDLEYEQRRHRFEKLQDVEQYWYELWSTCMNTLLGGRLCVDGKIIVVEQLETKPAMIEAMLPHSAEEAILKDTGHIPGNKKGAAGLDSAMFAHLKRNWNWIKHTDQIYPSRTKQNENLKDVTPVQKVPAPVKKFIISGMRKSLNKNRKAKHKSETQPTKYKIKPKQIVRKIAAKLSKRKPYYDDIDKQALKKMEKLRTDWTPLEDHVLLLCLVASQYLCPNRHKHIIPFSIIRDVLHKTVDKAVCKTSRACQRRILYIMKNPNTRRSVNMCLEEIRQNSIIYEKYSKVYKQSLQSFSGENLLNIAFIELVAYMSQIFTNLSQVEQTVKYDLPDSVQKLKEVYQISRTNKKRLCHYKEPESELDITVNVLKTVIHSSMCCSKDKSSWSYHLFKVYQQYPEALLRTVVSRIRYEQMISLKRSYIKARKASNCMPMSSSPYQLSITYKNQLMSKYPYSLYEEAFQTLKQTSDWLKSGDDFMEIGNTKSGTVCAILEMTKTMNFDFQFEIPEEVIILNKNVPLDNTYDRLMTHFYNILHNPEHFITWDEKEKSDIDDEDNFPTVVTDDSRKNPLPKSSTRISFYMMRAEMSNDIDEKSTHHMHDFFVVNTGKIFLKYPRSMNLQENMSLGEMCENLLNIQPDIANEIISSIKRNAIIPKHCPSMEELEEYLNSTKANNHDIAIAKTVINFICEKGFFGATLNEIQSIVTEPSKGNLFILDLLDTLTDSKIIIQTGAQKLRYVHFDFKKPWIIDSHKILRLDKEKMPTTASLREDSVEEKMFTHKKGFSYSELQKSKQRLDLGSQQKIKVLMSPWIRIDGSLNRRVLDRWFGAILNTCLDQPGISLETLSFKFHSMKPVDVIILVKYLIKMKCLQQYTIKKSKTTFFSSLPSVIFGPATGVEDSSDIIIEPSHDAVTKLAVFIGEKNYFSDFLS